LGRTGVGQGEGVWLGRIGNTSRCTYPICGNKTTV
jgi:hypothetical protein